MYKETFFIGLPVEFKKRISIFPPSVANLVEDQYFQVYIKFLTETQEDIEDEIMSKNKSAKVFPSPFENIFLKISENQQYEEIYKKAFFSFIHQEVNFLPELRLIVIGKLEDVLKELNNVNDLTYINEKDYFEFQNLIRESIGEKTIELPNPKEHSKIKEMKRKARYRDRVKAKQNAKKGEGISLFLMLVSICCMGLGITPLNIGEMSYCAIKAIFAKFQDKEKYALDIQSLLAGADSKKVHPKYWIKNFED